MNPATPRRSLTLAFRTRRHLSDIKDGAVNAFKAYTTKDLGGLFSSLAVTAKKVMDGEQAQTESRKTRSSEADCIAWSGCKDNQVSVVKQKEELS